MFGQNTSNQISTGASIAPCICVNHVNEVSVNATGTRTASRSTELMNAIGWQPEIDANGKQPVICGRSVPHELTMADLRNAPAPGTTAGATRPTCVRLDVCLETGPSGHDGMSTGDMTGRGVAGLDLVSPDAIPRTPIYPSIALAPPPPFNSTSESHVCLTALLDL